MAFDAPKRRPTVESTPTSGGETFVWNATVNPSLDLYKWGALERRAAYFLSVGF